MIQTIHAELYRLSHKRSTKIYYGVWIGLFLFVTVVLSTFESGEQILLEGINALQFVSLIISAHAFSAVYCDDFKANTLGNLVSTGKSHATVVSSKLIVMTLFTGFVALIHGFIFIGIYLLFGGRFSPYDMKLLQMLVRIGGYTFASIIGFSAITSVVVYRFKNTALSIVGYILITTGWLNYLFSRFIELFEPLKELSTVTLSSMLAQIRVGSQEVSPTLFIAVLLLVVLTSSALSTCFLKQSDLS
ncbi:hypothetical protein AOC36_00820 [Erysipelothrix larvae]|uniref:Uncharacterized protein n=1 Tax=Erysipelothrix larvae TaxID=1514105 RepID=A0A0X8GY59_9FIRM|nr:ABC transporter permease [Erysipelothrix larvae]AMC92585.1 hypothetical protein AOC36_00820 [Erysipelothrix larvae]